MAVTSVNWATGVITVPQTDLTSLGGSNYQHNVNTFRLALKVLEASEEGLPFRDTHNHITEVTLSGVTYARFVEILDPYTVTYENGNYRVYLVGANNNIVDKLNLNSVQVIPSNSAGLINNASAQDIADATLTDGRALTVPKYIALK